MIDTTWLRQRGGKLAAQRSTRGKQGEAKSASQAQDTWQYSQLTIIVGHGCAAVSFDAAVSLCYATCFPFRKALSTAHRIGGGKTVSWKNTLRNNALGHLHNLAKWACPTLPVLVSRVDGLVSWDVEIPPRWGSRLARGQRYPRRLRKIKERITMEAGKMAIVVLVCGGLLFYLLKSQESILSGTMLCDIGKVLHHKLECGENR